MLSMGRSMSKRSPERQKMRQNGVNVGDVMGGGCFKSFLNASSDVSNSVKKVFLFNVIMVGANCPREEVLDKLENCATHTPLSFTPTIF